MSLMDFTAVELGEKIKSGDVSVVDAAKDCLDAIERSDKDICAFITRTDEKEVIRQAEEIQKKIDAGELSGPLAGVPVAIKDNICTEGVRTTCASRILSGFIPPYSATVVSKLQNEGALIVGKTNMDEFAMGSTTETSYFGVTKNPWDLNRVPGGSSGGSAAAVSAHQVTFALGSDTGGSIRQPCAYCGVTGIKPTYGSVSRNGLIAYGSSLEQIGPIAKDVRDCAVILEAIMGHDTKDSTSVKRKEPGLLSSLTEDITGVRIGVPRDYFNSGTDIQIKDAVLDAVKVLTKKGAVVEEFDLSLVEYAVPAYYIIASAEASSNLSRFDGVKYGFRTKEYNDLHQMYKRTRSEGFGEEVKRRIMLGSFVLSAGYYDAYYMKALKSKALIKKAFDSAFEKYDVILGPVTPSVAPETGTSLKDPIKMYLGDIYTVSANLAGLPAISVPCGLDEEGMPIGLQLMGDCFNEKDVLKVAYAFEKARDYQKSPAASGGKAV